MERVEYVVRCAQAGDGPEFSGWFALWRARRESAWLRGCLGCGPHRIIRRTYVLKHRVLPAPGKDEFEKWVLAEEDVTDAPS